MVSKIVPGIAVSQPPAPEREWEALDDGEGNLYYYHRASDTTTWEKPVDFDADLARVASAVPHRIVSCLVPIGRARTPVRDCRRRRPFTGSGRLKIRPHRRKREFPVCPA